MSPALNVRDLACRREKFDGVQKRRCLQKKNDFGALARRPILTPRNTSMPQPRRELRQVDGAAGGLGRVRRVAAGPLTKLATAAASTKRKGTDRDD